MSGPAPVGRDELRPRTLIALQRGGLLAPDVLLVDAGGARVVVKDWAGGRLRALVGRWLSRREAGVYRALAGHPSVPRYLGRIDACAFALEHRPGRRASRRRPPLPGPAFGARLEAAVADLHARGVVHLDLRHRDNLLCDPEGRPVLVDFGAALRFRPGSAAGRWLLPQLARLDRRAIRKWRRRLTPRPGIPAFRAYALGSPRSAAGAPSGSGLGASRPT